LSEFSELPSSPFSYTQIFKEITVWGSKIRPLILLLKKLKNDLYWISWQLKFSREVSSILHQTCCLCIFFLLQKQKIIKFMFSVFG
jgi:hypothetical protein